MHTPIGLFALVAGAIVAAWWWLGSPVAMPPSPLAAGEKLYCISYAPFRPGQTPLVATTRIDARQIDEDLRQLARISNCVRTYSIEHGLDQIPEIAQRHGLKVLHGIWLSSFADKNKQQIETTIALAKRFPDVIRAVIVGNEVLLRGEMSVTDLANTIRGVKSQVSMPVTYADVWEFWVRFRQLNEVVDFVTIHILPYWEDVPIPASNAAAHLGSIRRQVAGVFPGREILIGETGWPSAGRMREGALPSPANQARVLHDVLALAKRQNFNLTVIEAYDQPWKRNLEGTVGGHWGLFDAYAREVKFVWGQPVSNHPQWPWQAAGGVIFAALVFAAGFAARRKEAAPPAGAWAAIAVLAVVAGTMLGWAVVNVPIESLGLGGWARSLALVTVAFAAPLACSAAIMGGVRTPSFARVLARRDERARDPLALTLGVLLIALTVLAIHAALGLAFDPRYRDFPFAALTAAIVPFLVLSLTASRAGVARGAAEVAAAGLLVLAALYIVLNESFANWQSVWFCALLVVLAFTLVPRFRSS
jgi:exo-beta-1,3-glucanase (GH17 family)